jgi:hypothetical protein
MPPELLENPGEEQQPKERPGEPEDGSWVAMGKLVRVKVFFNLSFSALFASLR